ncbi:hypothetical protein FK521_30710, partial [Klebsiella pneumoniae]|nr:hypothetical protein [Klebsiella pneumoniae]
PVVHQRYLWPDRFVWTTYAALQSLQAGLNQSDDPAEIAKYLKGATVDTVMGPLSWDQKAFHHRGNGAFHPEGGVDMHHDNHN